MATLATYVLSRPTVGFWCATFSTDLGWMSMAVGEDRLHGLVFGHQTSRRAQRALGGLLGRQARPPRYASKPRANVSPESLALHGSDDQCHLPDEAVEELVCRLQRYAAGEVTDFSDVRLCDDHLPAFSRRVVSACRRIPWGRTSSYGELAAAAGSPAAARAVGQVMANNRYPIIVPCHRVVGADGALSGFSAPEGPRMKRRLLRLEAT